MKGGGGVRGRSLSYLNDEAAALGFAPAAPQELLDGHHLVDQMRRKVPSLFAVCLKKNEQKKSKFRKRTRFCVS